MSDYYHQFMVHLLLNDTVGGNHCLARAQAAEKDLQKSNPDNA